MPESTTTQIPRVLWAQQRDSVLLTVTVPDLTDVKVDFTEDSVTFKGRLATTSTPVNYEVTIKLYEKINTEKSKYESVGQKLWRILLKKQDEDKPYWPRLTSVKEKLHWLAVDFDHWKDEDESGDEMPGGGMGGGPGGNFQDMFAGGGMGGMGMGGGLGGMPDMSMDDEEDDVPDSDDEETSDEKQGMADKNGLPSTSMSTENNIETSSGTASSMDIGNGDVLKKRGGSSSKVSEQQETTPTAAEHTSDNKTSSKEHSA